MAWLFLSRFVVCIRYSKLQAARTTMDINLRGVIRVCQAVSPLMTPNPRASAFVPHVVNLSSMGAIKALQTVRSPLLLSRIKALD